MYWYIAGAYCTADRYRTARILRRLTAALCGIRCAGPAPASGNRPVAVPWGKDAVAADTVPRLQCVAVGAEAAGQLVVTEETAVMVQETTENNNNRQTWQ